MVVTARVAYDTQERLQLLVAKHVVADRAVPKPLAPLPGLSEPADPAPAPAAEAAPPPPPLPMGGNWDDPLPADPPAPTGLFRTLTARLRDWWQGR